MKKILIVLLILFSMCSKSYAIEFKEVKKYIGKKITFQFFNDGWLDWKYQIVKGELIIISRFWKNNRIHLIIKVIEPIDAIDQLYSFSINHIREIKEIK